MQERYRLLPPDQTVRTFVAQKGAVRRTALRNFDRQFGNINSEPITREQIFARLRSYDQGRMASPGAIASNKRFLDKAEESYGDQTIRTLLPIDSPVYTRIMNMLGGQGVQTKEELLKLDLVRLGRRTGMGSLYMARITDMQELAKIDIQNSSQKPE